MPEPSNSEPIERLTYTLDEVCQALGVSERVIRQWVRREHRPLPVIRATARGGRLLFSREAVQRWLVEQTSGPRDRRV